MNNLHILVISLFFIKSLLIGQFFSGHISKMDWGLIIRIFFVKQHS